MSERNRKTMAHQLDCIALDEPEQIGNLRELDRGDRVLIDERRRPLTVVDLGIHVKGDDRINKEIKIPMVKLQGHWPGAKEVVLKHQVDRTPVWDDENDRYVQRLGENEAIVENEYGREVDVRRTHVVGASGRAEAETRDKVVA